MQLVKLFNRFVYVDNVVVTVVMEDEMDMTRRRTNRVQRL